MVTAAAGDFGAASLPSTTGEEGTADADCAGLGDSMSTLLSALAASILRTARRASSPKRAHSAATTSGAGFGHTGCAPIAIERATPSGARPKRKAQEKFVKGAGAVVSSLISSRVARYQVQLYACLDSRVPVLVMDHEPIAASDMKREEWWQRLEKHGFVAGNMLRHTVEDARLYAAARGRRHSV